MKHYVYLAGPIAGLTYGQAVDWRTLVSSSLNSNKTECLDPLRGKSYLASMGAISPGEYSQPLSTSKAITRRDMFDTLRATCLFVNLLESKRVSIGTVMEIAWAYQNQIPTVVVMEKGNLHEHAMIEEASTYVVETLEEGVEVTKFLLNERE